MSEEKAYPKIDKEECARIIAGYKPSEYKERIKDHLKHLDLLLFQHTPILRLHHLSEEELLFFIKYGFDLNRPSPNYFYGGKERVSTLLEVFCYYGMVEEIKILLKNGADVNIGRPIECLIEGYDKETYRNEKKTVESILSLLLDSGLSRSKDEILVHLSKIKRDRKLL